VLRALLTELPPTLTSYGRDIIEGIGPLFPNLMLPVGEDLTKTIGSRISDPFYVRGFGAQFPKKITRTMNLFSSSLSFFSFFSVYS